VSMPFRDEEEEDEWPVKEDEESIIEISDIE
jgi:hypothetical protein